MTPKRPPNNFDSSNKLTNACRIRRNVNGTMNIAMPFWRDGRRPAMTIRMPTTCYFKSYHSCTLDAFEVLGTMTVAFMPCTGPSLTTFIKEKPLAHEWRAVPVHWNSWRPPTLEHPLPPGPRWPPFTKHGNPLPVDSIIVGKMTTTSRKLPIDAFVGPWKRPIAKRARRPKKRAMTTSGPWCVLSRNAILVSKRDWNKSKPHNARKNKSEKTNKCNGKNKRNRPVKIGSCKPNKIWHNKKNKIDWRDDCDWRI
mmetsp:Transcript_37686/g.78197  ORF Transcript_37686/g.78197 Transcript_37686/m.78197 type:complete len:253 (+) Transcript_37686:3-761(+)